MAKNEHGWNDPPRLSYEEGLKLSSKKPGSLNKTRPHYPTPGNTTLNPSSSSGTAPVIVGNVKLQTTSPLPPPPTNPSPVTTSTAPPPTEQPSLSDTQGASTLLEREAVLSCFTEMLEKKRSCLSENHATEIGKRLQVLSKQWNNGKISANVHSKLSDLIKAIEANEASKVQSIQMELMVDHVTEVSQWMVGVKKLINAQIKE